MFKSPEEVLMLYFYRLICLFVSFCPRTAERSSSPKPRLSETDRLQEELPRLPGEPAVQRPQPHRVSETQRPTSYCHGKYYY